MQRNVKDQSLTNNPSEKISKETEVEAKVSKKMRGGRKAKSAFRTISEVASHLGVQQHVLRFWESKFSQVKPLKRGGGRRYYRPEDVQLLERIHHLLYSEGYTIKGVQKLLRSTRGSVAALDKKMDAGSDVAELSESVVAVEKSVVDEAKEIVKSARKEILQSMLDELKSMRKLIDA